MVAAIGNLRNPTRRIVTVLFSATSLLLASCGSDSPGDGIDRTPAEVSFTVAEASVREGAQIDLQLTLSPPVERETWVRLVPRQSNADRNVDFELDPSIVRFSRLGSRGQITIRVFDDWLPESDESFSLEMESFSPYVSAGSSPTLQVVIEDDGDLALTPRQKAGSVDFYAYTRASFSATRATLEILVLNRGAQNASATTAEIRVFELVSPGSSGSEVFRKSGIQIPPIDGHNHYATEESISLLDMRPNRTYWVEIHVREPEEELRGLNRLPNRDTLGFTLDEFGEILVTCKDPNRSRPTDESDPLIEHQWNLRNTGQRAFSRSNGTAGEDLNMAGVLSSGTPTGRGVKVAVVDTGLEICHPDLADNVVAGESFNFKFWAAETPWHNVVAEDPFFPDSRGDHGTSVAGIIAAVGDNGLGTRGVAPDVELYGFNFLSHQCCEEDALGASQFAPNSAQIDVFNMSYGSLGSQYDEPLDSMLKYGTTDLRDGRGAIYVKAAGNGFGRCSEFRHQVHVQVGCSGSNGDAVGDTPYIINVGALDADGLKASYSSAGSNIWISAPSGEYGFDYPATLTSDQYGRIRGYSSRYWPGISQDDLANPYGDYISNFNGTSAAAPQVAGVVALLLEEQPELTWRDVKHVLANTSRQPGESLHAPNDVQVMINGRLATFQRDWVVNAAGYEFHNHFGFGAVDVDAALALLREDFQPNQLGEQVESDWISSSHESVEIPDHDGGGIVLEMNVELPTGANIEAVVLQVVGTHTNLGDLSIELTSPQGTPSILNTVFNEVLIGTTELDWNLLTNAFYGESPRGNWRLRIVDAAEGDSGVLDSWALRFWYAE